MLDPDPGRGEDGEDLPLTRTIYTKGNEVALAAFVDEDYEPLYETWQDLETQRNFNVRRDNESFEEFVAFHQDPARPPSRFVASILRLNDGRAVGRLSLAPAHLEPDLGIWIFGPYRSQGYGSQAVRLAVDHLFHTFDLDYIVAGIFRHNTASMRVFEAAGFRRAPELDDVQDDAFGDGKTTELGYRINRPWPRRSGHRRA